MVIIAIRDGQAIGAANAGNIEEARYIAHNWLRNGVADEVSLRVPGQLPRTIYS